MRALPRLWRLHAAVVLAPLAASTTAKPLRHVRSAWARGAGGAYRPPPEGSPLPLGLSWGSCADGGTLPPAGVGAVERGAEGAPWSDGGAEVRAQAWWRWAHRSKGAAPSPKGNPEIPHTGSCTDASLAEDPLAVRLAVGEGAAAVLAAGAFTRLVELVPPGYETGFEIPITVAALPAHAVDAVVASDVVQPAQVGAPPGQGPGLGLGSRSSGGGGGARMVAFLDKPLLARVTTRREQHERAFKAAMLAAGLGPDPSRYPGLPLQVEGSGLPEASRTQAAAGAARAGNDGGTVGHAGPGIAAGLGLGPGLGPGLNSEEGAAVAATQEAELAGADAEEGSGSGLTLDPGAGAGEAVRGSGSGLPPDADAAGAAAGAAATGRSALGSGWVAGAAGAAAASGAPAAAPAASAGQEDVSGCAWEGSGGILIQCALTMNSLAAQKCALMQEAASDAWSWPKLPPGPGSRSNADCIL